MNRISKVIASTFVAIPLAVASFAASAQTANTPGGSAATGTALDQSKPTGTMAPTGNTATNPSTTNPGGTLNKSAPATGGTMAPSSTMAPSGSMAPAGTTNSSGTARTNSGKANTTKPGDAPTYPAPAKDGTPTK